MFIKHLELLTFKTSCKPKGPFTFGSCKHLTALNKSVLRFLSFFFLVNLWSIALQRTALLECASAEVSLSSEWVSTELEEDTDAGLSLVGSGDAFSNPMEGSEPSWATSHRSQSLLLPADIGMHKIRQHQLFLMAHFQRPAFYLLYQTLDGYLG